MTNPESVGLRFSISESDDDDPYDEGLQYWSVEIRAADDRRIGYASLTVVEHTCPDPSGQCDAECAELGLIARGLWPGEPFDDEEVRPGVGLTGLEDVALITSIRLDPEYRGRDLGLRCAAEILAVLTERCEIVALRAHALDSGSLSRPEVQRWHESLTRFWTRLGLRRCPDVDVPGLMIGWLDEADVVEALDGVRAGGGVTAVPP